MVNDKKIINELLKLIKLDLKIKLNWTSEIKINFKCLALPVEQEELALVVLTKL